MLQIKVDTRLSIPPSVENKGVGLGVKGQARYSGGRHEQAGVGKNTWRFAQETSVRRVCGVVPKSYNRPENHNMHRLNQWL